MTLATFYSGTRNASSWAMRAWLALRMAEFPFEEIVVDIRRPQRYINLDRLARISPSAMVPALVVGEAVLTAQRSTPGVAVTGQLVDGLPDRVLLRLS